MITFAGTFHVTDQRPAPGFRRMIFNVFADGSGNATLRLSLYGIVDQVWASSGPARRATTLFDIRLQSPAGDDVLESRAINIDTSVATDVVQRDMWRAAPSASQKHYELQLSGEYTLQITNAGADTSLQVGFILLDTEHGGRK